MAAFEHLLAHASEALLPRYTSADHAYLRSLGQPGSQLADLLILRNGFYAYNGAFLVRGLGDLTRPCDLRRWNSPRLWIEHYNFELQHTLFFAEDIFGIQFAIYGTDIVQFDPETGRIEQFTKSFDLFVERLVADSHSIAGNLFLKDWQQTNGPLERGQRLVPKVPFVCGGEFKQSNFWAQDEIDAMKFRASIANQIKNLPDGSQIVFRISEESS